MKTLPHVIDILLKIFNDETIKMVCAPCEDSSSSTVESSLCVYWVVTEPLFLRLNSEDSPDSVDGVSAGPTDFFVGFVIERFI